jgi:hypothetical protein
MLETFKARLKAKTKAAGVNLSQKRIDAFADRLHKKNPDAKEDADHDKLIDELDELVAFADVAKEDDRVRTLEAKVNKPAATKPKEEVEEEEETDDEPAADAKPKKKERIPGYMKIVLEKLEKLEKEKTVTSIQSKIKSHEKMKDVPEDFYDEWVKPEKEEDVDTFAEKVATKWGSFKQKENNEKASGSTKPVNGSSNTAQVAEKDVDAILDNIMPGTKAPASK